MALHDHVIRNDRLEEKLAYATELGTRKIPTEMTIPLAQIKHALRDAKEIFDDAVLMLQDQYTEGEWKDVDGKKKFTPRPVLATNEDGTPKFKEDPKTGKPTEEREIAHGRVQLTNSVQHGRELRELKRMTSTVRVPHLPWLQLSGKMATLEGNITEALWEFFDGLPTGDKPEKPAAEGKKKDKS